MSNVPSLDDITHSSKINLWHVCACVRVCLPSEVKSTTEV